MASTGTRRVALALALCVQATSAAAVCEAWPGEPEPLPTLADEDSLRAEWASLRARELALLARDFEAHDALRAQQLWRHLLCLEPTNAEALASVVRTAAVRVHRPPLLDGPVGESAVQDPWLALGAPLGARGSGPVSSGVEGDLFIAVRSLDEEVRRARFKQALRSADALRSAIAQLPSGEARLRLLVETEVLAATAELAMGDDQKAESSLRRALDAYPGLELDVSTTSPKVLRALDAARSAPRGGGAQ